MSQTRILYRADGGHPVGMGHIMRALRLMRELSRILSPEFLLVTRRSQAVARILAKEAPEGLAIQWMEPVEKTIVPILGAEEFVEAAGDYRPDILIVDALDTPAEGMALLYGVTRKLVAQDDRGSGRLYANLISNFLVRDPDPSELSLNTTLMEGPQLAPLAEDYAGIGKARRKIEPVRAQNVAVSLGGADAVGLAVKVAEALALVPDLDEVRFVVGPAFQRMDELTDVTSRAAWSGEILSNAPSLLPIFLESDLAIVAGGITMHEAACCGVPAVAVCQPIDHQMLVGDWLQEAGTMLNLGYGTHLEPEAIASAVAALAADHMRRQRMAECGPKTVDGHGTRRVAEAIASVL